MISGVDNFCHVGGLVGGILITMGLGIDGKSKTFERVNGFICLLIYVLALSYLIFLK